VLFAFVILSLVSSVLSQEIGWEERFKITYLFSLGCKHLNSISKRCTQ